MTTLSAGQVDALLTAGSLAPSGGNTQPWRAKVSGSVIELSLDPARCDSVLDASGHAAVMALGSFTENVVLTAPTLGLRSMVDLRDGEMRGAPLVKLRFEPDPRPAPDALFDVIAARETNRRPHVGPAIPDAALDRLCAAATRGGGHAMHAIGNATDKRSVAGILARADRVRVRNRPLHREMFSELRWTSEAAATTHDGIDVRSLHLPAPGRVLLRVASSFRAARHLLPGVLIESLSQQLLVQSSHLCALTMKAPRSPASWFEAGRTIERVWLTAELERLAIQPWTVLPFLALHPRSPKASRMIDAEQDEIAQLSLALRDAFGMGLDDQIFFVFRLSTAPRSNARAPRRPWKLFAEVDVL